MKYAIVFSILFAFSDFIVAQTLPPGENTAMPIPAQTKGKGKIDGVVKDSVSKEPVPFATIALISQETGAPVNGTMADENGKFEISKIEAGVYDIEVSFIGYESKVIKGIVLSEGKAHIDLGEIKLGSTVQQLKEVTIIGEKPVFEEKVDRTVYNAENDLSNKGGDASDVLRKVPMLSVDLDGNVSLRGSENVKVLINNKPSTIAATSVADALRQIPADMIKSVEVITSPSAKYDAEGSAGIINIITKKNTLQGAMVSVDGSVGVRASSLGLNGSYRKGKMGFSLGGHGRWSYNTPGSFRNTQTTVSETGQINENIQYADTRNNYGFGSYQLGWDYDIDQYNLLTASARFGFRSGRNYQDDLTTERYQAGSLENIGIRNVFSKNSNKNFDVNLNYTRLFKKPMRELSFMALYSRTNSVNDFTNSIMDSLGLYTMSRLKNLNDSYNQEATFQADYQTPIDSTIMLEAGVKSIYRNVTSDYKYFSAPGSDGDFSELTNNTLSNKLNYNQNVIAAYSAATKSFKRNYTAKVGLRYEYTIIDAKLQSGGTSIDIPSYGILVPSINVSKKLNNGSILKASYNRRVQRPSLRYLNPNLQAANPLNVSYGNPNLDPEYTNNFELGYNAYIKRTSLTISAFTKNSNNAIQSVRNVKGDTIVTTYQNIGSENTFGVNIFANVKLSDKFSLNGGTDVYYAVLKNNVPDPVYNASNEGWVANYRLTAAYKLPKDWEAQLFTFYRGRRVHLQGYQGGFGIYSLSFRKRLKDDKGSVGFGAENFFHTSYRIRSELTSPFINQKSTNVLHNMNFKMTFTYKIGKMSMEDVKPKKRRKLINNDDMKDGGGEGTNFSDIPSGTQGGSDQGQAPVRTKGGSKPGKGR